MIKKYSSGYLLPALGILLFLISCAGMAGIKIGPPVQPNNKEQWIMLGKDPKHQFHNKTDIVPPLKIVWKKTVKSVVTDHPLAFADYIVVTTQDGVLNVLDYRKGSTVSSGRIGSAISHAPTILDYTLYTGLSMGKHNMLAFNLETAQPIYRRSFPEISTSPLILDESIYFGTERRRFYCIEKGSGDLVWRFETKATVTGSPASSGQALFFSDIKGNVYALGRRSGKLKWMTELHGNTFSYPVISDSVLFLGTTSGNLFALNIDDGAIRWKRKFEGSMYSSPSVYGADIYIGNNNHKVFSLQKKTGKINWEFETGGVVNTVPLPSTRYVYATCWDHFLYVLNRQSGELVYKHKFESPIKSSPIIYRNFLILQASNRKLYALTSENFNFPEDENQ